MTDGKVNPGTYASPATNGGVMYDALLDAAAITGDQRYADYVKLDRISSSQPRQNRLQMLLEGGPPRQVKDPPHAR